MKKIISFVHMNHSPALENLVKEKLHKVEDILGEYERSQTPCYVEVHLTAQRTHPNHSVDMFLRTKNFSLDARDNGPDMYEVIDSTIDKMVTQVRRGREKFLDKRHKAQTPKNKFRTEDDQYPLSDSEDNSNEE